MFSIYPFVISLRDKKDSSPPTATKIPQRTSYELIMCVSNLLQSHGRGGTSQLLDFDTCWSILFLSRDWFCTRLQYEVACLAIDTNKIALTISNLRGYIDTWPRRAKKDVGDEMHGPNTTNTTLWANQKGTREEDYCRRPRPRLAVVWRSSTVSTSSSSVPFFRSSPSPRPHFSRSYQSSPSLISPT